MRHEFESGAWVEVIPVQDLKLKHRQKLKRQLIDGMPLDAEGELDTTLINSLPGGMPLYDENWRDRRLAAVAALVITGWSYDLPRPEITDDGQLVNAESMGDADLELADVLDAHLLKLTRQPDPKAVTTSASNGRSKAKAAVPTA